MRQFFAQGSAISVQKDLKTKMPPGTLGRLGRCLWSDLPLINFAYFSVALFAAERLSLSPPRVDLLWTFIFPLAVPLILTVFRWRRSGLIERLSGLLVLFSALAALFLISFSLKPHPIPVSRLRLLYEYGGLANTALLGLHAWQRSRNLAALFFAPVTAYGLILENGGILLGYFKETGYSLYVGPLPAPLATMSGWISVFYLIMSATWELRLCLPSLERSAVGSSFVAAFFALCLDLQLDPLATAVGFWRWNDRLTALLLGVPVLNFVAWACAVLPFSFSLFRLQMQRSLSPEGLGSAQNLTLVWQRIPFVLAVATALFFGAMALIEGGFHGPTFEILAETIRNLRWQ